jgi:hypothetical protein
VAIEPHPNITMLCMSQRNSDLDQFFHLSPRTQQVHGTDICEQGNEPLGSTK